MNLNFQQCLLQDIHFLKILRVVEHLECDLYYIIYKKIKKKMTEEIESHISRKFEII